MSCPSSGKETGIGRNTSSPFTTIGVLSLGVVLPLSAGPFTNKAIAVLTSTVEGQAKTITLVRDGQPTNIITRAATVAELLREEHIDRDSDDMLDTDSAAALADGEHITYRTAKTITLVVDGRSRSIRTSAERVAAVLIAQHVEFDPHDAMTPAANAEVKDDATIDVEHVAAWIDRRRSAIAPSVHHVASLSLALGATKVVSSGWPGVRETSYLVERASTRSAPPIRSILASRILRSPHPRVVATGIGEYGALATLAARGFQGTVKLARAALAMVATAYTANCMGCSGLTASGKPAGHGIVAVDPRVIPMGSHLYIPGYGAALAGDTGGSIRGNRIDLGFISDRDAREFGRRNITVYVLGPP